MNTCSVTRSTLTTRPSDSQDDLEAMREALADDVAYFEADLPVHIAPVLGLIGSQRPGEKATAAGFEDAVQAEVEHGTADAGVAPGAQAGAAQPLLAQLLQQLQGGGAGGEVETAAPGAGWLLDLLQARQQQGGAAARAAPIASTSENNKLLPV